MSYLSPLIEYAKNVTFSTSSRWGEFPIYLKATAGMRVLKQARRVEILSWVRQALSNSSFNPFLFDDDYAIIISGEEEALFGWLTVNYYNGLLFSDQLTETEENNYMVSNTYGSLDMGGRSTQITFAALPSSDVLESLTKVEFWDKQYRLYAHSFLQYGVDAMYERLGQLSYEKAVTTYGINSSNDELDFIDDIKDNLVQVGNPCLNNGYNDTYNISLYYESDMYSEITLHGSSVGEENKCRRYIRELFYNDSVCLTTDECGINGVYQKSIVYKNQTFYAFEAYAYAITNLGFDENERYNLSTLQNISEIICNFTYDDLYNSNWGTRIIDAGAEEYLFSRCLELNYIVSILHDMYGFPMDNTDIVFATKTENGDTYGWPQGSILYDANLLSYTLKSNINTDKGHRYNGSYICFVLSSVLLILNIHFSSL